MMKRSRSIFWGLILLAFACYLVLTQFGIIVPTLGFGHIIMGIICVCILVSSIMEKSVGGACVAIGLAWVTFDEVLGIPEISIFMVAIIMTFIGIGLSLLFPTRKKIGHQGNFGNDKWADYEDPNKKGEHQRVLESEDDGFFYFSNKFGAAAKYVKTSDLKGVTLENSFGELKVYLDGANVGDHPVDIFVSNSFGATQLFVPKGWNVIVDVSVVAGTARENPGKLLSNAPVIRIKGKVNFGELQISYIDPFQCNCNRN